jgi:hypothetical protein
LRIVVPSSSLGSALSAIAWVLLVAVMALCAAAVDLSLDAPAADGELPLATQLVCLAFAAALGSTTLLHHDTRGPLPMIAAVAATLSFCAFGLWRLFAERGSSYRLAFALACALPLLLLLARRWRTDESDRWFRRWLPRTLPPLATLSMALVVSGLVARRASDPNEYARAAELLGRSSALDAFGELALLATEARDDARIDEFHVPGLLERRMRPQLEIPPGSREAQQYQELARFLVSEQVARSIRLEVAAACAPGAETYPLQAHACARAVVEDARRTAERRQARFALLAFSGVPIAGLVLALLWRARRPRLEELEPPPLPPWPLAS